MFSEEITHALLLHANDLNALFLDDILEMISQRGWNIVSLEKAFQDPSWRQTLLQHLEWLVEKPATLNCQSIDHLLEAYHVFSEKES